MNRTKIKVITIQLLKMLSNAEKLENNGVNSPFATKELFLRNASKLGTRYIVVGDVTGMRISGPTDDPERIKKKEPVKDDYGWWPGGGNLRNWYSFDAKLLERKKAELNGKVREVRYTKHKKTITGYLEITWRIYDVETGGYIATNTERVQVSDTATFYDDYYDPFAPDPYRPKLSLETVDQVRRGIRAQPPLPVVPSRGGKTSLISREELAGNMVSELAPKLSAQMEAFFKDM